MMMKKVQYITLSIHGMCLNEIRILKYPVGDAFPYIEQSLSTHIFVYISGQFFSTD